MPNRTRYLRGWGRQKPNNATGYVGFAGIDRSHPLSWGMAHCWSGWQGAGNGIQDMMTVPNANPSQLTFAAGSNSPTWTPGAFGGPAIHCTALNTQWASKGSNPAFTPFPSTLLCWFWPEAFTAGDKGLIYIGGSTTSNSLGIRMTIGGVLETIVNNVVAGGALGGPVKAQDWSQAVAVFTSDGDQSIYTNGLLTNTGTTTGTPSGLTNRSLGGETTSASTTVFWNGYIDHGIVWNRALGAEEIWWLYNEPFAFLNQPAPKRQFKSGPPAPPASSVFKAAWAQKSPVIGGGVY